MFEAPKWTRKGKQKNGAGDQMGGDDAATSKFKRESGCRRESESRSWSQRGDRLLNESEVALRKGARVRVRVEKRRVGA